MNITPGQERTTDIKQGGCPMLQNDLYSILYAVFHASGYTGPGIVPGWAVHRRT